MPSTVIEVLWYRLIEAPLHSFFTLPLRLLAADFALSARPDRRAPSFTPRRCARRHTGFVTMNFAASAGKPSDGSGTPLKAVQIDGQVRAASRGRLLISPGPSFHECPKHDRVGLVLFSIADAVRHEARWHEAVSNDEHHDHKDTQRHTKRSAGRHVLTTTPIPTQITKKTNTKSGCDEDREALQRALA